MINLSTEEYLQFLEEDENEDESLYTRENLSEILVNKKLERFASDGDPRRCKTCD